MVRLAETIPSSLSVPTEALSSGRLAVLLALTALPVTLTSAFMSLPGAAAAARRYVEPPYLSFAVYALANWLTFALVVRVAGWERLRALGVRFPVTPSRVAAAIAGFVAGLGVYSIVSWWLRRVGLPPVRGMDFTTATTLDVAVLVVSAVVTAPWCEEVFFRVLWVGGLRRHAPAWVAGAISIVAFAAIHFPYFGIGGVIFISLWSIPPVVSFLHFRDLTAPLAMHVMNNAFAYLVVPLILSAAS